MAVNVPSMQELLEAGVHFGHKLRRGNPKMSPYVFGARDGVHIIDLAKSEEKLKEAVDFLYDLGKQGKVLLIIGTKKQARPVVEKLAKEVDTPYLTARWIGGILTNFEEIRKNIRKLTDLKSEKEKGQLTRYTKKEQLLIDRKLQKFEKELGGIVSLTKIPDAIFVVDSASDIIAIKEALKTGVTVVGFADTNVDPNTLDYPIPANDDGIKSIQIVCEAAIRAYGEGKKSAAKIKNDDQQQTPSDKKTPENNLNEEQKLTTQAAAVVEQLEEEVEKEVLEDFERKSV